MKLLIFGTGRMAHKVVEAAKARGHEVVGMVGRSGDLALAKEADVAIDFSHPDALSNHMAAVGSGKLVVGTTGWYGRLDSVRALVAANRSAFLFGANFSLSTWLFKQLVREAAALFQGRFGFDVSISETHHRHKVDHPSGTALTLGEVILQRSDRKKKIVSDLHGALADDDLQISSLRSGNNMGAHRVIFEGPASRIELSEQSFGRDEYAEGAVLAAEWLMDKTGFYTVDDMMGEYVLLPQS